MSNIGNYIRPEDELWFSLNVEHHKSFLVKAPDESAAWLKLNYFWLEKAGVEFVPEEQFPEFRHAQELTQEECNARGRLRTLGMISSSVIITDEVDSYSPVPVKRWPNYADWLREQAELRLKRSFQDDLDSLASVAEKITRYKRAN